MDARLYVIPGSHPARAAELILRYKGIDYKRRDLFPAISRTFTNQGSDPTPWNSLGDPHAGVRPQPGE